MPEIIGHNPTITVAYNRLSGAHPTFTKVVITFTELSSSLPVSYYTDYNVEPDAARRHLVHAVDPGLEERVGELITTVIDGYRARLNGRLAPDEEHPGDEPLDVARGDILAALKALFHQEPPRDLTDEERAALQVSDHPF